MALTIFQVRYKELLQNHAKLLTAANCPGGVFSVALVKASTRWLNRLRGMTMCWLIEVQQRCANAFLQHKPLGAVCRHWSGVKSRVCA